jgi:hypothetical protein
MSASWIRSVDGGAAGVPPLGEGQHNALADFPSEREAMPAEPSAVVAHRPSGVTMRVAPLSPGIAVGLVMVLLFGAGSAALIGLLATGPGAPPTPGSFAAVQP